MTLDDLKKKPVVSMADGVKVGEVDDLILDTTAWRVRDLALSGKSGRGILPLINVRNVGPDAATIDDASGVMWNEKATGLSFEEMRKLTVVDETGTVIGHIVNLAYASEGSVESFSIHQGGVFGLGVKATEIVPAQIRGVGEKLVTVSLPPAPAETE